MREQLNESRGQGERMREREQLITDLQRQLTGREQELTTVREQLNETQQREWVISRNDIQILEHELGRGAWGVVYRGNFVAVMSL